MLSYFSSTYPLILFLLIISFFSNLPLSFSEGDPIYSDKAIFSACSRKYDCGAFTNISYPFWGFGRPSYCGHPAFLLSCRDGSAEIEVESQRYNVMGINGSDHTIRLQFAHRDGWSSICEMLFQKNIYFHSNVFNYSTAKNQNIIIGSSCPRSNSSNIPMAMSSSYCGDYGVYYYSVYSTSSPPDFSRCYYSFVAPILKTSAQSLLNQSSDLKDVLEKGFEVEYNAIGAPCAKCQLSGGQCGYYSETMQPTCFCYDREYPDRCPNPLPQLPVTKGSSRKKKIELGLVTTIPCLVLVTCVLYISRKMFWKRKKKDQRLVENFIKNYGSMAPKRYSYAEIKKITNSFKDKIGQGGYGEVYKGKLIDGHPVAVKLMNKAKGNGEDFINEVASISRTSHVNIVSLLGFCFDESKRALLYEFMVNGSLEKFIYDHNISATQSHLGWDVLYKIAVGVARGLEYLHRGCNTLILHLDIKPHNILLDQDFNPKISDFGLAKLYARDESIASMLNGRGTPGYTAPEMINRNFGRVSHKSDVYSYGMMVLEMVGKRRNVDVGVDHSSEIYFPQWIYKRLLLDEDLGLCGALSEEDEEITKKMILVALWCIQSNPMDRPEMSRVEEMLEGKSDLLPIPPKPYLCSPPRSTPAVL